MRCSIPINPRMRTRILRTHIRTHHIRTHIHPTIIRTRRIKIITTIRTRITTPEATRMVQIIGGTIRITIATLDMAAIRCRSMIRISGSMIIGRGIGTEH